MKAIEQFTARMNAHAETLEAAGLADMVRGLRLAQAEAMNAIAAAVDEATSPKKRVYKQRQWKPGAREKMSAWAQALNAAKKAKKQAAKEAAQ